MLTGNLSIILEETKKRFVPLTCAFLFAFLFLFPLVLFFKEAIDTKSLGYLFSQQILQASLNSLVVSTVAALAALFISLISALLLLKLDTRYQIVFSFLLTWPMLLPSLSHGMGLIILFGKNSWFSRNFVDDSFLIYGFKGILLGALLYSIPIGFLMLFDILRYEDTSKYQAADILNIPKWSQFLKLRVPFLKKPLICTFFALFTLILTDYGVPLMVGGRYQTLPVLMYSETIGLLNYHKGAIIGTILLLPAVVAFVLDLNTVKDREVVARQTYDLKLYRSFPKFLALAFLTIISVYCLLPSILFLVTSFVFKYPTDLSFTWENIKITLDAGGSEYLVNSLVIALGTSIVGVISASLFAYFSSFKKSFLSKSLHFMGILSLAVPGLVLGLSYSLFFEDSILYGTLAILIFVNVIHFFASPYLMIFNYFEKVGLNLYAAIQTLGVPPKRFFFDILLPMSKATQLEMFSYFFINSMVTISAVAFISTVDTRPVSLMISQFEAQMQLECAAIVSLMILFVNLSVKLIIAQLKKYVIKY